MYLDFHQNIKQQKLISTLIIRIIIELIIIKHNQPIRVISEGSCDTEDLSNDAENPALHQMNKYKKYYLLIWNANIKIFKKLYVNYNVLISLHFLHFTYTVI